ncbi:PTS fructose transporter subunit IIB, partial [Salmonella enterica]|uniref:PTS fructose transporter subunit IIB n=1 Tax=Salmonella enterica TaxID=28901 RepID=UPI000CC8B73F
IAHTYMAAEKLQEEAEKLGHEIKVETQGRKTENELSQKEIENADMVVLAVDTEVDLDRFAGKKVKKVSTGRAIKEPEKVLEEAFSGEEVFFREKNK